MNLKRHWKNLYQTIQQDDVIIHTSVIKYPKKYWNTLKETAELPEYKKLSNIKILMKKIRELRIYKIQGTILCSYNF